MEIANDLETGSNVYRVVNGDKHPITFIGYDNDGLVVFVPGHHNVCFTQPRNVVY